MYFLHSIGNYVSIFQRTLVLFFSFYVIIRRIFLFYCTNVCIAFGFVELLNCINCVPLLFFYSHTERMYGFLLDFVCFQCFSTFSDQFNAYFTFITLIFFSILLSVTNAFYDTFYTFVFMTCCYLLDCKNHTSRFSLCYARVMPLAYARAYFSFHRHI